MSSGFLARILDIRVRTNLCAGGTAEISRWCNHRKQPENTSQPRQGRQTAPSPPPFQGWWIRRLRFRWFYHRLISGVPPGRKHIHGLCRPQSILAAALLACLALTAPAQQRSDDEIARNFVSTRGIEDRRGTEVVTSRIKTRPKRRPVIPIGLGYTLFKKTANGEAVRVNPSHEFRTGDEMRFVIESNTGGYLYIFHQMNDAPPKMIYPDAKFTKWGDNRIEAHELKDLRIKFTAPAATERFHLVIARTRLPAVLSGEKLLAYCQQHSNDCPWRPTDTTWNKLLAQTKDIPTRESQSRTFGKTQTENERLALNRDVKLQPGDPAPSIIKVSASPSARMLRATVEIVHK